jgi:hypothetical protein
MAELTGPDAYLRQQQAILSRPDSRLPLGSISCPTIVLVGDNDERTPPTLGREIATGIRGARLNTFAGWCLRLWCANCWFDASRGLCKFKRARVGVLTGNCFCDRGNFSGAAWIRRDRNAQPMAVGVSAVRYRAVAKPSGSSTSSITGR